MRMMAKRLCFEKMAWRVFMVSDFVLKECEVVVNVVESDVRNAFWNPVKWIVVKTLD